MRFSKYFLFNIFLFLNLKYGTCEYVPPLSDEKLCKMLDPYCGGYVNLYCNRDGLKPNTAILGTERIKIPMNATLRQVALDVHNELRNVNALGCPLMVGVKGDVYPRAAKLPKFVWNEELEYAANMNGRTCSMTHDCCASYSFHYPGQNLACRRFSHAMDHAFLIRRMTGLWFAEYMNGAGAGFISGKDRGEFPFPNKEYKTYKSNFFGFPNTPNEQVGHFGGLMREAQQRVGCALYDCGKVKSRPHSYLLACNYDAGHDAGRVYETSDIPGSKCKRRSKRYCGLCLTDFEPEDDTGPCLKVDYDLPTMWLKGKDPHNCGPDSHTGSTRKPEVITEKPPNENESDDDIHPSHEDNTGGGGGRGDADGESDVIGGGDTNINIGESDAEDMAREGGDDLAPGDFIPANTFVPPDEFCENATKVCGPNKHLFCGGSLEHTGVLGKVPNKIELNNAMKQVILRKHNELRNIIACGEPVVMNVAHEIFPKAAKMPKLTWDNELEWMADLNAKTCAFDHDCALSENFFTPGQIIGRASSVLPQKTRKFLTEILNFHFAEYLNTPLDVIDKYSEKVIQNPIDDAHAKIIKRSKLVKETSKIVKNKNLATIINDKIEKVGCAFYECGKVKNMSFSFYIVCNYGQRALFDTPIYEKSDIPGSKCSKKSTRFCCLCLTDIDNEATDTCQTSKLHLPNFLQSSSTDRHHNAFKILIVLPLLIFSKLFNI